MQITTAGIVLHTVKYSENKIIVKVFTKNHGLKSFIINRNSKKNKFPYFQHLAVLEFVYQHKENVTLQTPKEIRNLFYAQTLYSNILKSSIILFLSEILHKSLKEDIPNADLFQFITDCLQYLDTTENSISLFPILFLLELARYLGFAPLNNYNEQNKYFDLYDGRFIPFIPQHLQNLDEQLSFHLHELLNQNIFSCNYQIPFAQRLEILKSMTIFFQLHQPNMGNINALEILHEVFNS